MITARIAASSAVALALLSCGQGTAPGVDPNRLAGADGPAATATALAAPAPACGTGAHDRHAGSGVACASCHPCGGTFGFTSAPAFPGGTDPSGGSVVRTTTGTTCTVACHFPLGATPQTVSWSTPGPLACTSCHSGVAPPTGTYASAHAIAQVDPVANRAGCQSCHDTSLHTSGHVRIDGGSGVVDALTSDRVALNAACQACHSGTGRTIANQTPPLLPGWTGPTGDFHGARAGTGFGGTLVAPYQVGQGPLACTECHDAHASTNAFLFAARAGGLPVTAIVPIDRAGVGAEALCANCHAGNRHAGCMTADCHPADPAPAGKPCFFCHGHEGIVNFKLPTWADHPNGRGDYCSHCHATGWFPAAVDHVAPTIVGAPIAQPSARTATISWTTGEPATSYVEYGTSTLTSVQGDGALATSHAVTLTGLSELTGYAFRVRSSDALRNVTISTTSSFSTTSSAAPPTPVLVAQPDAIWEEGTQPASYVATFSWSAVAAPDGHPVEYRFQLATAPTFAAPVADVWLSGTTAQRTLPVGLYPGARYYWRVQARDAADPAYLSAWTPAQSFAVYWYMPY